MKKIKNLLLLLVAITISSCSSNDDEKLTFDLSTNNIAGSYNITKLDLNIDAETITSVAGQEVAVPLFTSKGTGDTFQVDFNLNTNGTFTFSGQYRITTVIKPTGSDAVESSQILNFDDAEGRYSLNSVENTITFIGNEGFLEGTFSVKELSETTIGLTQNSEFTEDSIKTTTDVAITFLRK